MIYMLKFGASFVLPPGLFFLLFWGIAWYLWRRKERKASVSLTVITAMFYLLSTSLVADWLMSGLESKYPQAAYPEGDVIIMLGGGATSDTPNQGELGNLCASPASRLLTALELHNRLQIPILVSGGQVYEDSGPEAVIAKRKLMRLGVAEKDIILEPNSLNTRQNAMYSAELLHGYGYTHPILVTSAFHMERSVLNFEKEGLSAVAYPTDYRANTNQVFHYNKLMPKTDSLDNSVTFLREKLRTFVTRYFE